MSGSLSCLPGCTCGRHKSNSRICLPDCTCARHKDIGYTQVEFRLCECGCGGATRLNQYTDPALGYVKGQPNRFIHGHNAMTGPCSPGCTCYRHTGLGHPPIKPVVKGYRGRRHNGRADTLHRVRAEIALGKPLPPGAVVHHADGSKNDNAPLVICQNENYHRLLHARMRARDKRT